MPKTLQSPGAFLTLMLEKYKLNPFKLSKDIKLSQSAVRLIAIGKTKISVPVAYRLAKYFNTNAEYWLKMQMTWDLAEASKDKALMGIIKSISRVKKSADVEIKPNAKKPVAKKAAAKKPAAKKKAVVKKPTVKKVATKKVTAKKPVAAKKRTVTARKSAVKAGRKPVKAKPAVKRGRKPAK
jgi:addiction module HigA family antidote